MLRANPSSARYPVDPSRLDLVEEYLRSPLGPHSEELKKLLHRLRWTGETPRFVLIEVERGRTWKIGRMPFKPGDQVSIYSEKIFTSIESAEREVFRIRWESITGGSLRSIWVEGNADR